MDGDEDLNDTENILLKFTGLRWSRTKSKEIFFQGPVKIKNTWFNIKLICPSFPRISNFRLHVQQNFNITVYTNEKLNVSEKDCATIEELLEKLPMLVDSSINHTSVVPAKNQHDAVNRNIYAEIVKTYSPLEYEVSLNEDCSMIQFTKFCQNEQHFLKVALPSLELLDHSLPLCIDWKDLLGKSTSLSGLLHKYQTYLEDLRTFYENFADIDELCHIVQPSLPTTKANWRLFVLKEKVFIKLQFNDPFSPLSSMSVHIIGPTYEVSQLRRVYSEGLRDWDSELNVHKNLLRIFNLCFFPMPPAEGSEESLQFCNICYCYKLENGDIPIVSCDNNRCSLIFHSSCLKEWFNTLTDGKTFLDVTFGACPFCKSKLSTSFQEILA